MVGSDINWRLERRQLFLRDAPIVLLTTATRSCGTSRKSAWSRIGQHVTEIADYCRNHRKWPLCICFSFLEIGLGQTNKKAIMKLSHSLIAVEPYKCSTELALSLHAQISGLNGFYSLWGERGGRVKGQWK